MFMDGLRKQSERHFFLGSAIKLICLSLALIGLWGCASATPSPSATETNLGNFAMASCLGAYFQKHNWDDTDIRGISGGYVELGESGAETYVQIAETIRSWKPEIPTKHGLDIDLVKCFHLNENPSLNNLVKGNLEPKADL